MFGGIQLGVPKKVRTKKKKHREGELAATLIPGNKVERIELNEDAFNEVAGEMSNPTFNFIPDARNSNLYILFKEEGMGWNRVNTTSSTLRNAELIRHIKEAQPEKTEFTLEPYNGTVNAVAQGATNFAVDVMEVAPETFQAENIKVYKLV